MNVLTTTTGETPEISDWLVKRGLAGDTVDQLVSGLFERLVAEGWPLLRGFVGLQTLHPLHGGYGHIWRRGVPELAVDHYLRQGGRNEDYKASPFQYMRDNDLQRLRVNLEAPAEPEFPIYQRFRDEGGTDYFVRLLSFGHADGTANDDGIMVSLLFDRPGGMSDDEIARLDSLLEVFALAGRSAATYATALSVTGAYLGKDAGQRVMHGEIDRGTASSMRSVIFYADLRGFTPLTERLSGPDLLATLDNYLDAIARPILEQGGEVLKFLGDGVLAVFEITDQDSECHVACQNSVTAGRRAFAAIDALNINREFGGQPTMELDLAMHIGDVLYGNVGAEGRLDFTVIGPAVNEASRIKAMCDKLGRHWLVSEEFYHWARQCTDGMEDMGRHQLRGLSGERALYSLPPYAQQASFK